MEVDFYNLTFLIELIVIFGLVHQELVIHPLKAKTKTILDDILDKGNIKTINNSRKELEDNFNALRKKYEKICDHLLIEKNIDCILSFNFVDIRKCISTKLKIITSRQYIVSIILMISIIIYVILLFAYPSVTIKTWIASYISKTTLYYLISFILVIFFGIIVYSIKLYKLREKELFNDDNIIKKLTVEYLAKYKIYKDLELGLIEKEKKDAEKDIEK